MPENLFSKHDFLFIEDDDSLNNLITNHLANTPVIALDSEFLRFEHDSPPKLALVQFKTGNIKGIIDPLKCQNISSFISFLFENKRMIKIFHDAKQDLETFQFFINFEISKDEIFDVQIAELFTHYYTNGTPSYKELVAKYTGKNISKQYQNSNWLKRPISDKKLAYALNDVEYLLYIHEKQKNLLDKMNRFEIFQDSMLLKLNNHINKIKAERNLEYYIDKDRIDGIYKNLCNNCEFENISPSVIATKNDIKNILIGSKSIENIEKWKLKFLKID